MQPGSLTNRCMPVCLGAVSISAFLIPTQPTKSSHTCGGAFGTEVFAWSFVKCLLFFSVFFAVFVRPLGPLFMMFGKTAFGELKSKPKTFHRGNFRVPHPNPTPPTPEMIRPYDGFC